jgi:hypothetical protein
MTACHIIRSGAPSQDLGTDHFDTLYRHHLTS